MMGVDVGALGDDQCKCLQDLVPGGREGQRGPRCIDCLPRGRRCLDGTLWHGFLERRGGHQAVKRRYQRGALGGFLAGLSADSGLKWLMISGSAMSCHFCVREFIAHLFHGPSKLSRRHVLQALPAGFRREGQRQQCARDRQASKVEEHRPKPERWQHGTDDDWASRRRHALPRPADTGPDRAYPGRVDLRIVKVQPERNRDHEEVGGGYEHQQQFGGRHADGPATPAARKRRR